MKLKILWRSVVVVNLLLILYFWLSNSFYLLRSADINSIFIAFGRLTGLLLVFFILIQLFLISRFTLLEREYGFDKLNILHRKIGNYLSVFLVSHPLLLIIGYAGANKTSFFHQFLTFQNSWEDVLPATIAFFIIIIVALTSIKKIKNKIPYEFWYFIHLPIYIAIAIAFGHQTGSGDVSSGKALIYWYLINFVTFGILILYRFIKPLYGFLKHQFFVEKIVKESENVYSVYISGKNMKDFKFQSGQYANIIFFQKKMWTHHPFSFSDSYNGKNIRFSIKTYGDFTSKISNLKTGTKVWIDGPLGTFTLNKAKTNKYLFVAGGIGITPILSMIKSLDNTRDSVLLYSNKLNNDLVFKDEIESKGITSHYLTTENTPDNKIDITKISELCTDFKQRDIYICGPSQMIRIISDNLHSVGVPKNQIHFEMFGY